MSIRKIILIISVLLVFIVVGTSVKNREDLLNTGETFLFSLAPVAPRSIMQGDYMILNYRINSQLRSEYNHPPRGYIVFQVDSFNVVKRIRYQRRSVPLSENERVIKYYKHKKGYSIGSESYFFQEGDADVYARAMYGGIKVARNGESILFGLYDNNHTLIEKK